MSFVDRLRHLVTTPLANLRWGLWWVRKTFFAKPRSMTPSLVVPLSIEEMTLHGALLRNLGMTLLEILDLRDLGVACASDGIYDFLFTAAPLNIPGGTGGPVNPVVLKASDTKHC